MAEPVAGRWDTYHAQLKGKTAEEFNTRNRNMIDTPANDRAAAQPEGITPGTRQVTGKAHSLDGGPKPPWFVYNRVARINHRDAQSADRREARLAAAARKDQMRDQASRAQNTRGYQQNVSERE